MNTFKKRNIFIILIAACLVIPLAWGMSVMDDDVKSNDTYVDKKEIKSDDSDDVDEKNFGRPGPPPHRRYIGRDLPHPPHGRGMGMGWGRRGPQGPLHEPERIQRLRKEYPELAEVIEQCHRVKAKLHEAVYRYHQSESKEEKTKEEEIIQDLLKKEYELEVQRQKAEIKFLEQRIEQLKELIDRFQKAKEKILEHRLQRYTEDMPPFMGERPEPPKEDKQ